MSEDECEYEDCSWEDVYRAYGCPVMYEDEPEELIDESWIEIDEEEL